MTDRTAHFTELPSAPVEETIADRMNELLFDIEAIADPAERNRLLAVLAKCASMRLAAHLGV